MNEQEKIKAAIAEAKRLAIKADETPAADKMKRAYLMGREAAFEQMVRFLEALL